MPQIANQDYNVIRIQYGNTLLVDADALGKLAGHIERSTLFDTIVEIFSDDFARPVGIYDNKVLFFDADDSTSVEIQIVYKETQYEGLAAVQVACELTEELPALQLDGSGYLQDGPSGNYLCVDGKLVSVTSDDNRIATLVVSNEEPGDEDAWVDVPFDELQKLVGVQLL